MYIITFEIELWYLLSATQITGTMPSVDVGFAFLQNYLALLKRRVDVMIPI